MIVITATRAVVFYAASLLFVFFLVAKPASAVIDVPAEMYKLTKNGDAVFPALPLIPDPLPSSVTKLLDSAKGASFTSLSTALQRALLYDAGYILTSDGSSYVQVRTKCGKTMADIFVSKDTVQGNANCTLVVCNRQILTFAYPNCSADAIVPDTRCAIIEDDDDDGAITVTSANTFWSEEGLVTLDSSFQVFKYDNSLSNASSTTVLYTIFQNPTYQLRDNVTCPNKAANFVVPCQALSPANAEDGTWCVPLSGSFVELWLHEEVDTPLYDADHRKWVRTSTIFISFFALACVAIGGFVYVLWRKKQFKDHNDSTHYAIFGNVFQNNNNNNNFATTPGQLARNTIPSEPTTRSSQAIAIDRVNEEYLDQSDELVDFCENEELLVRKIEYDALKFEKLIAKGANGEVWRGEYAGQFVAIKRLLTDMRSDVRAIEIFSREIRLGSSLEHPNIVRFIGLSWRSLAELSMISEFLPIGDLARFLVSKESRALTWKNEKLSLASDIAKALVYLHSLVPVIIHRDLKSLNILLTATFEAKLSDFGLSRERSFEETMTMGVGTLLWTAPEVLRGDRYSEKADIYSYGIVLSELDTCLPPYSLNDEVRHSKSVELLPLIRGGRITPRFRPDCPPAVLTLADACLNQTPEKRPNAMQIVYMLQSKISMSL
ncbi:Tkl protein kinase, partial [Globisporangium splendens]